MFWYVLTWEKSGASSLWKLHFIALSSDQLILWSNPSCVTLPQEWCMGMGPTWAQHFRARISSWTTNHSFWGIQSSLPSLPTACSMVHVTMSFPFGSFALRKWLQRHFVLPPMARKNLRIPGIPGVYGWMDYSQRPIQRTGYTIQSFDHGIKFIPELSNCFQIDICKYA